MSRAALSENRNSTRVSNGLSRASTETPLRAIAAVNGTKRTADGQPRVPDQATETNDTLIKKLISDMRIYTNNVIQNEIENMKRFPQRTYHSQLAIYNAKKLAATREMLETVMVPASSAVAMEPITPSITPTRVTSTRSEIEAFVKKEVNAIRNDLFEELSESISEQVMENMDDAVAERWALERPDLKDDVLRDLAEEDVDEEMVLVKETVLNHIRRAKELGDANDTQDQLRVLGDFL